jgi:hypothetical protein
MAGYRVSDMTGILEGQECVHAYAQAHFRKSDAKYHVQLLLHVMCTNRAKIEFCVPEGLRTAALEQLATAT